jgi:hypothetical protein
LVTKLGIVGFTQLSGSGSFVVRVGLWIVVDRAAAVRGPRMHGLNEEFSRNFVRTVGGTW